MKYSLLLIFSLFLFNCSQNEDFDLKKEYKFTSEYTALVTVGGFAGTINRTFEKGEIFVGVNEDVDTITIRIAAHTKRNEDCPNSWCYQEFLEVPREFLELVK